MENNMTISITPKRQNEGLFNLRRVTVRERFLRFLFGDKIKLTVIVPGNSVDTVAIKEIVEGGEDVGKFNTNCCRGH